MNLSVDQVGPEEGDNSSMRGVDITVLIRGAFGCIFRTPAGTPFPPPVGQDKRRPVKVSFSFYMRTVVGGQQACFSADVKHHVHVALQLGCMFGNKIIGAYRFRVAAFISRQQARLGTDLDPGDPWRDLKILGFKVFKYCAEYLPHEAGGVTPSLLDTAQPWLVVAHPERTHQVWRIGNQVHVSPVLGSAAFGCDRASQVQVTAAQVPANKIPKDIGYQERRFVT